MNGNQNFSKLKRLPEIIIITLFGGIPAIFLGAQLRIILYRSIFARIGNSVYIQDGVEFPGSHCIEIGSGVKIHKGSHINATGHANNRIYIGDEVNLQQGVNIKALDDTEVLIDKGTYIGPYVCLAGPGNIKIGKSCLIAANTGIFANNHIFSDPTKEIGTQGVTRQGIVIEDDCWLGHGVTVLDGVTIGRGSVVGAGSVVTKDIPPYSVAVGVPTKVIRSRTDKESDLFVAD